MNLSRQALLGMGMIVGGSVMLYAMVNQVNNNPAPAAKPAAVAQTEKAPAAKPPLTTDVETEKRLLAQKQKEREARVAEQQKRAQEILAEQEEAAAQALAKSRAENQQYLEDNSSVGGDSDSPEAAQTKTDSKTEDNAAESTKEAEAVAKKAQAEKDKAEKEKAAKAEKEKAAKKKEADSKKDTSSASSTAGTHTIQSGDVLGSIARQYGVSVAALAAANNMSPSDPIKLGKTLKIPAKGDVEKLEKSAADAKKKRELEQKSAEEKKKTAKSEDAKQDAQKKLESARQKVKETDAKGSFGVQVALATSQNSADEVAKRFKAAGYKVKTSRTSRGVRVVVGPERGKVAALALKDKINSDPEVKTTSAWVLYW
ncbi:SPOR and LysM peptidoglycan-binding domain-containing protein [Psychrobacter aestuarii]|uniref:SPOR domain-containing protein n=1 Tax=Psychrobacter aestuarii TaxID=556327 RepID=A0ABP3FJM9_9GAMM|nr:LysM peptidoglycan-binding domain-containing protein [Psychrobacter aestuarii]